jgi:hypothetical protein
VLLNKKAGALFSHCRKLLNSMARGTDAATKRLSLAVIYCQGSLTNRVWFNATGVQPTS